MKKAILVALVIVCSLSLISCKDNSTKKVSTLDAITTNKKIIAGTEASFPPFEYVKDGKIQGYNPELAELVFKPLNVQVEHLDVPFSGIFTGLKEKKFDAIITALGTTNERKESKDFVFTTPIAENKYMVIVDINNDTINSMEDLDEKVFGINLNSIGHKNADAYNEQLKKDGKKGFEIKTYNSNLDTLADLSNNRIDFTIVPNTVIYNIMDENPDKYKIVCQFNNMQNYMAWAVRTDDKELLEFINKRLMELKKDGTMQKLQEKYFNTEFDLPDTVY